MASSVSHPRVFNATDRVVEGWYWALPSADLRPGQVVKLELLGRSLVAWRGADDGVAHLMDAHCPHMGAHLGEGWVEGDKLRCFFHAWAFSGDGSLASIPCTEHRPQARLTAWPTVERYGLIWIWTGPTPRYPVPTLPELDGTPLRTRLGRPFRKGCHPNVVMVNAIDEQHFSSVHHLPVDLHFDIQELDTHITQFDNTTRIPTTAWWQRLLGRFYDGPLTYRMVYWSGTNGSVTVGPDLWHFHILFALRPTPEGHTEGIPILLTPAVRGPLGWAWNQVALTASQLVGDYFAKGDTEVFQSIRWNFATPLKADRSIVRFIQLVERQPTRAWATWDRLSDEPTAAEAPA